jgi:hypothetical protein
VGGNFLGAQFPTDIVPDFLMDMNKLIMGESDEKHQNIVENVAFERHLLQEAPDGFWPEENEETADATVETDTVPRDGTASRKLRNDDHEETAVDTVKADTVIRDGTASRKLSNDDHKDTADDTVENDTLPRDATASRKLSNGDHEKEDAVWMKKTWGQHDNFFVNIAVKSLLLTPKLVYRSTCFVVEKLQGKNACVCDYLTEVHKDFQIHFNWRHGEYEYTDEHDSYRRRFSEHDDNQNKKDIPVCEINTAKKFEKTAEFCKALTEFTKEFCTTEDKCEGYISDEIKCQEK